MKINYSMITKEQYDSIIANVRFTAMERKIFELKLDGMADIDIAIELDKCRSTIINYKNRIDFKVRKYL